MDKIWEIKDPDQYLNPRKAKRPQPSAPRIERDPGRAYTLSLLFWGSGQSYNDQHGKALAFQVFAFAVLVATVVAVIYRESLFLFLRNHDIAPSRTLLSAEIFFLCLLVFWLFIAGDAYQTAARTRSTRFHGTARRIAPCFCSLLVPGWGQFLNGQPIKGSLFSALAVFGIFAAATIPATLLSWTHLEPSDTRFLVEEIFTVTVLYAPLVPLLWLVSAYDAFQVSRDELKKESLWERIKAANNRRRTQGWVRGVFPQIRSTLVLVLVLAALALIVTQASPAGFYSDILNTAAASLRSRGMILLPEIIDRILSLIVLGK